MALLFHDLTPRTRELMLCEIELDEASSGLYLSSYLNHGGRVAYPPLLKESARSGSDSSLAANLRAAHAFSSHYMRSHPKGISMVRASVPHTAPETLSQSQFNMYYIRALCIRATEEGREMQVYRARTSENPRPESERMIGSHLDPERVLRALRDTKGVNPPIGIPMPNSGLSVRLL
jgi:hypothetical protein